MKRDMDLIREILFKIEESGGWDGAGTLDIPSRSLEEVAYHLRLLNDAELVATEEDDLIGQGARWWSAVRLTWQGHEFLDAARDDTIWRKVKAKVIEGSGGLAFDVLKAALLARDQPASRHRAVEAWRCPEAVRRACRTKELR